jgi:hypothetical protein
MEAKMSSCQITNIPKDVWRAFRFLCLKEGISANRKLLQLIEAEVLAAGGGTEIKDNSTGRS